jgi:hypothetical protein
VSDGIKTALRLVLIVGQCVGLGFLLAGLFQLGGCGPGSLYQREWSKVPPGALEACNEAADRAAREATVTSGRFLKGTGQLFCESYARCTCFVSFER